MVTKPFNLAFHRQQLAAWVAAYQLDRQLRGPEPETPERTGCKVQSPDGPSSAAGQIRLLVPTAVSLPAVERPVYVLLMPAESAEAIRLIPFSRYPLPATPPEWRTGFDQQPLRGLRLWNQHVCDRACLPASWFVRTITAKQQADVTRALQVSHDLRTYAARRFGPPLLHAFDPRHVYLQEERMLLDDLCTGEEETAPAILEYPISETNTPYRLAAEPPADYKPEG